MARLASFKGVCMTLMSGKTVVVTGANSGIGRETARGLAGMGARVIMVCRSRDRGEEARQDIIRSTGNDAVELELADLSAVADTRRAGEALAARLDRLDVLVNNAGAMHTSRLTTVNGYEMTFAVNHLSYFLLTHTLLPLLKQSAPARIVNVSSRAHEGAKMNFDDLHAERGYSIGGAYGQSKLANVLFTYELARRLEGTNVTTNCLHPGVVRTGFGKNSGGVLGGVVGGVMRVAGMFFIGPEKGAATSIHLASSPDLEGVTGKYFADCKERPSSAISHDREAAQRLWDISEQMVGISAAP